MCYIQILNCCDSSKTFDLAVNTVKCSGCLELALPGIFIITSHIVVCMVTSYNHKRTKNNFLEACIFNLSDNFFACGVFRLTFNSSDESVCESKVSHLCLHLIVCYVCCMRSTMSHEYECCSIFCGCFHAVISCYLASFICDSLCNCFLVVVDHSSVITNFTKHWLCDCYRFEFVFVVVDYFYHLIVLSTMHQMCRLNNKVLNSVCYCTVKSLIHVVDCFIISCLYMVDDDLCCESTSYGPVRISCCQSIFDSFDILCTAVVKGSTKAYNKKFVLTDLILVAWVILGSIACVTSEIFRACFFTFYQFFLCVCQSIPCFFGCLTVLICCVVSFLNVDLVDQCCNVVCCCLVIIRCLCCIVCSFCVICCLCCSVLCLVAQ